MSRRRPAPRRAADPREVGPIALVVDSGGMPVTHRWRPSRRARWRETQIGVYRQRTDVPDDEPGRHVVWSSDEEYGDGYPWGADDPRPYWLTRFMREASEGRLSAAFALTDYGREAAQTCKCRSGAPLEETERAGSKKTERGGLNAKAWKKELRRRSLETDQ